MGKDTEGQPAPAIRSAFQALRGVERLTVISDPSWHGGIQAWFLKIRIVCNSPSGFIPRDTDWYVLLNENFPLGSIKFFPSKQNGLEHTFPHQDHNSYGPESQQWRNGKLCLDSPLRALGSHWFYGEPLEDPEERILWHGRRAVGWVDAAAGNMLLGPGDPFELPQYPVATHRDTFVYDESTVSLQNWKEVDDQVGRVVLKPLILAKHVYAAAQFETFHGRLIHKGAWRNEPIGKKETRTGIWWRWPKPVVIEPWQASATWGDLRQAGHRLGVDVDEVLHTIAQIIRGKEAPVLFLGYPIPRRVEEPSGELHWKALLLPELDREKKKRSKGGFANHEKGKWYWERSVAFASGKKLDYCKTDNWHPDRLQARGRIGERLRQSMVSLIGGGALGSAVAELLVRGGVCNLTIYDDDIFEAGNAVRHTLTLNNLFENKAQALAQHLREISPYANVAGREMEIAGSEDTEAFLRNADVIIDCTASDRLIACMASCWWPVPKIFVSLSLGFQARRLFLYIASGNTFPVLDFRNSLKSWLESERESRLAQGEVFEGAGCWSPLFPARWDDVMLAASSAIRPLEHFVANRSQSRRLIVLERTEDQDGAVGFGKVTALPDQESEKA